MRKIFGYSLHLDLAGCNDKISNRKSLEYFALQLCREIDMKPFGKPRVVHFGTGHATGYSLVQLIETSLISGHFTDHSKTAHLDIFSCKSYSSKKAADYCRNFFEADIIQKRYITRLMKKT